VTNFNPVFHANHIPSYGADLSGLVYGYVFPRDGIGRVLDTAGAAEWLSGKNRPEHSFVWLHFSANFTSTQNWLQQHVDLPEEFAQVLKFGSRTTRIEQVQDGLIVVLNDVVYDMAQVSSLQVSTLWLAVGPDYLISVRNQPLRSVDRLRAAVSRTETFSSPLSLVVHLLSDQADVLAQIMRSVTEKVDNIEDSFLADRLSKRANLGQLCSDLVRLQRLLAPEPSALFRMLNRPPHWIGPGDAQDLRQATEEFALVLRDIASLQERIKLLQEEIVTVLSERTNRSVFVLTAVTVIALPINLTAGLLGMNVGGVPYNQNPAGFWIVLGLLALATALATWMVLRLRKD
jgi:zinc transporter